MRLDHLLSTSFARTRARFYRLHPYFLKNEGQGTAFLLFAPLTSQEPSTPNRRVTKAFRDCRLGMKALILWDSVTIAGDGWMETREGPDPQSNRLRVVHPTHGQS